MVETKNWQKPRYVFEQSVLLTIVLDFWTPWYSQLPIGNNQLRPVDPREATIQEEQQTPNAA